MNVDIYILSKKMKDSTQQHYTVSLRLLNIFLLFYVSTYDFKIITLCFLFNHVIKKNVLF